LLINIRETLPAILFHIVTKCLKIVYEGLAQPRFNPGSGFNFIKRTSKSPQTIPEATTRNCTRCPVDLTPEKNFFSPHIFEGWNNRPQQTILAFKRMWVMSINFGHKRTTVDSQCPGPSSEYPQHHYKYWLG
jgi:hypothetical protein